MFPFLALHTEPWLYNRAHLITGAGSETPTWGPAAAVAAQAGTAFTWCSHTTLHVCDSYHGRLHSDCGFGFLPGSLLKPHPSQILPPTTKVWVDSWFEDLRGQAWEIQFISPQPATLSLERTKDVVAPRAWAVNLQMPCSVATPVPVFPVLNLGALYSPNAALAQEPTTGLV